MTDQRPPTYTGEPTNQTPPDFNLSTPEQTSKRVNITLTLVTDVNPGIVLAGLTQKLGLGAEMLEATSAHAFDLNDDDDQEPQAQLVISHDGSFGGIQAAYVDQPERAAEHAKNIRGVVVTLPIDDDFRSGS